MQSIETYGFRVPILALADGEVVDGDLRLQAAERLGLAEVPVVPAEDLGPDQVRAFRLMANSSAGWSGWNEANLALEVQELRAQGIDLELTGLAASFLEDLLERFGPEFWGERDADALPGDGPRVCRAGDVWELGAHRLLCGDATDLEAVRRLMADEPADMAFTDPPYNVAYEGKAGRILNDHMEAEAFERFLFDAFTVLFLSLRKGAPVYVAHSDTEGIAFRRAFGQAGFRLSNCLVWAKDHFVLGRGDYQPQHEPILYGWKPGERHRWYGGRRRTTLQELEPGPVLERDGDAVRVLLPQGSVRVTGRDLAVEEWVTGLIRERRPKRSDDHPTMKPVALVERFLKNSSRKGDVVLDPFGGSGSTLVACERTGRRCRTAELDPRFADVIVRRWQELTGGDAVLAGDGRTFAQVDAAGADRD